MGSFNLLSENYAPVPVGDNSSSSFTGIVFWKFRIIVFEGDSLVRLIVF